jgi:hypothetical protein
MVFILPILVLVLLIAFLLHKTNEKMVPKDVC